MKLMISAVNAANIGMAMNYFYDLHGAGTLKQRIPEVKNVNPDHALNMIQDPQYHNYLILDTADQTQWRVVGEFMFSNFQGGVAQLHFSSHPDYYGKRVIEAAQFVLSETKRHGYFKTLVGLTPLSNRLAIRLLKLVGFKPLASIPYAFYLADEGCYDDAMLSTYMLEES